MLPWADGKRTAILDPEAEIDIPRRKVALLAQTTKSEESFAQFVARFVGDNISRINELRIVNTTCPETGERYHSARELTQTCADTGVETHHIERALQPGRVGA